MIVGDDRFSRPRSAYDQAATVLDSDAMAPHGLRDHSVVHLHQIQGLVVPLTVDRMLQGLYIARRSVVYDAQDERRIRSLGGF
jgi:hypothetical protein